MKSCRNPGMEMPRCQILPAPAAWGEAATPPVLLGVSSAACGTGELPGSGKPHRISAPGRFFCQANLVAPWLACSRPGVPG